MANEALINLLPMLTGGLIAVLGGAVGPTVSHLLITKKEKKRERIKKIEEIFELLGDYDHWIENERMRIVWGETHQRRPSPLLRAQAISALYFPDLRIHFSGLDAVASSYLSWMTEAGIRRLHKKTNINDGFSEAYNPYRQKWIDCTEAVSNYAILKGDTL